MEDPPNRRQPEELLVSTPEDSAIHLLNGCHDNDGIHTSNLWAVRL